MIRFFELQMTCSLREMDRSKVFELTVQHPWVGLSIKDDMDLIGIDRRAIEKGAVEFS